MRMTLAVVTGAFGLLIAAPVCAHHSFATEFDATSRIILTGPVTKVEWMNPHVYFYVDVRDSHGHVANWACETAGPNSLARHGWRQNSLGVGDRVTVIAYRAKDGAYVVSAREVVLANGHKVFAGSPYDGGPKP